MGTRTSFLFLSIPFGLVLLLFVITSTARPASAPANHDPSIRQTKQAPDTSQPQRHFGKARNYPTAIAYDSPHKRMMPGLSPVVTRVKMIHFQKFTAMVPITAPAGFLEEFFMSIAQKCHPDSGEWSLLPQRNTLSFVKGAFRLSFNSVGDTIPWNFVQYYAERLWKVAALGLTELFEGVYADDLHQVGVRITLTLVDESSGSGSEGFREGSVPSINSV